MVVGNRDTGWFEAGELGNEVCAAYCLGDTVQCGPDSRHAKCQVKEMFNLIHQGG